jgi:hypothetical protein
MMETQGAEALALTSYSFIMHAGQGSTFYYGNSTFMLQYIISIAGLLFAYIQKWSNHSFLKTTSSVGCLTPKGPFSPKQF